MSFHEDTPLEDVLKYVKQVTKAPPFPDGIPIYVDPIGLQEAEKSMNSTVRNIDLQGVPLRVTLKLVLNQLDLTYNVKDGFLKITSLESANEAIEREEAVARADIEGMHGGMGFSLEQAQAAAGGRG